jgi:predicted acylesterase/phospholipase RssA
MVRVMRTRIGMMLPGAVALGAYEGGALAAVLKAVQASGGELVVDAIASASAGSMTALIAARALQSGADPVDLMKRTWVDLPQLDTLKTTDLSAPLTMDNLTASAKLLLGTELVADGPTESRQAVSVRISMALTVLGGLTYSMQRLTDKDAQTYETLLATTYIDFYTDQFPAAAEGAPATEPGPFLAALDGAMASGSNPAGFPPRLLDRTDAAPEYEKNGILKPAGKPFKFWYSDGGDIDNQPFGRLLDLIGQEEDPGDDRVIVMLNIEPAGPPSWEGTWFDPNPEDVPSWLSTLLHVNHIRSSQSLYDDLRRLQKTNRHIAWIHQVAESLEASLGGALDPALSAAVGTAAGPVAEQHQQIRRAIRGGAGAEAPEATPVAASLETLLREAAGVDGKREVVVEVISPEIDPNIHLTANQQLSGEFLGHFGGFFDPKFRRSDFALGYRNARYWLTAWLEDRVTKQKVTEKAKADILAAVKSGYDNLPEWRDETYGNASLGSLSIKEKVEGIDLLGHIGHIVEHDLALDVAHVTEGTVHHLVADVGSHLHIHLHPHDESSS